MPNFKQHCLKGHLLSPNTIGRPRYILWRNIILLLAGLLFLPVFAGYNPAKAGGAISPRVVIPKPASVFDTLRYLPADTRLTKARDIYKKTCRRAALAYADIQLKELLSLSRELGDKPLECSAYTLWADYYSVNRRFNKLSTSYYQQSVALSRKYELPYQTAACLHRMAGYYAEFKYNALACRYFLDSREILKEIGFDKVPDISVYLYDEARFYYSLDDYENARPLLLEAMRHNIPDLLYKTYVTNTIGLIYRSYGQFPAAMRYFERTLAIAQSHDDSTWVGIAKGNIGSVYFLQKQYARALPYIETDFAVSFKHGEMTNAAIALLRLIKISLENNKLDDADKQMATAGAILRNNRGDVLRLWGDLYDLQSQFYQKKGQYNKALIYKNLLANARDSLVKRDNIAAVERERLKWEMDKYQARVSKLQAQKENAELRRNGVVIILGMSIVIFILIYSRQRLKARKSKELLLSEKNRLDEELKNASFQLLQYTENLKQKNDLVERFKSESERLRMRFTDTTAEHLEELMQAHIMTDKNWEEFKRLFSKVHKLFFFELRKNYPGISETDTRMLALIKLQLNNREIGCMLGITPDAVKKAKQRLRKKMHLELDDNIELAITSL